MNENTDPRTLPLYHQFLTDRLERLRQELPGRPNPYYRMLLIKAMREETTLSPREAMGIVDAYYREHGLAIPQPSIPVCILFGVVGSVVLLIPMALVYWLWRLFQAH